jgi:hypothetical protein
MAAMSDQPPPPPPPASPLPPPPPGTPGAPLPQPIVPTGSAGLLAQFTGNAGWGILVGLATIIVPLVFQRVFFFLPIIGLIIGVYAIVRKQVIGGILAVVLNVIGGVLTIIGLGGG